VSLPRWRRWTKVLFKLAYVVGACLLLCELLIRTLLFSDVAFIAKYGEPLRKPGNFANHRNEEQYWTLQYRLNDHRARSIPCPDPLLGWVCKTVTPQTYEHENVAKLDGRRPVLLFGDSYAQCVRNFECWQDLMQSSELSPRLAMLNYGTGGYGLDQIVLLMEQALQHYEGQDPIVIVSILIDSDLDRDMVGFRGWPKAQFRVGEDGEAEYIDRILPSSSQAYLEEHGVDIRSYAWRWLLHGSDLLPHAWERDLSNQLELDKYKRLLARALIRRAINGLEQRGVDYFFMLFHGPLSHNPIPLQAWQEPLLHDELNRQQAPFVSSWPEIEAALAVGQTVESLYVQAGRGTNHYTADANALVFESVLRGLRGEFEGRAVARPPTPITGQQRVGGSFARFESAENRIALGLGSAGKTQIAFELGLASQNLRGTLERGPDQSHCGPVVFEVLGDGQSLFRKELAKDHAPEAIDIDITGFARMTLRATGAQDATGCATVYVLAPMIN